MGDSAALTNDWRPLKEQRNESQRVKKWRTQNREITKEGGGKLRFGIIFEEESNKTYIQEEGRKSRVDSNQCLMRF